MPVTREIPDRTHAMLRQFVNAPVYDRNQEIPDGDYSNNPISSGEEGYQDLLDAVQTAIQLEHATIPLYLSALYQIKPNYNPELESILRNIVVEEMLHMAMACNMLIALGGEPNLTSDDFIPNFVAGCELPGKVLAGTTFQFQHLSKE